MYIYISLVVFPVVSTYISCESTSDLPKEIQHNMSTLKSLIKDVASSTDALSSNLNVQSLKRYLSTGNQQIPRTGDRSPGLLRTPLHLTKLTKTLSLSFDPSLSKDYFEPFESRPRPLTLVAFRKNGLVPKRVIRNDDKKSLEVAVLQSPYNSIGFFWQDEPGVPEN